MDDAERDGHDEGINGQAVGQVRRAVDLLHGE